MTKLKTVEEIGREQHIHWLGKSATAQLKNIGEMTVLPYGYLGTAIEEVITQDRQDIHTSLVAAVEKLDWVDMDATDNELISRSDTLTIINSIFKE